jgi:alcohol dehydrogenase
MKIRSAVLSQTGMPAPYATSRPISIEALELGDPQSGELRVRMVAAGLCHSDLSIVNGSRSRPVPIALGHEACGIVEELGPNVHGLAVGDLVALVFVASCTSCIPCLQGRPALCEPGAKANAEGTMLSGARHLYGLNGQFMGKPINHQVGVSSFSTHAVVSQHSCVKISDSQRAQMADDPMAAVFGCAVITGVGAVVNTAKVEMGSTVGVVGLGGVGLCALLGALASGAREVIAIDVHQSKLDAALALGATAAFNANDPDLVAKVKDRTGGKTWGGVDYGFEFAGVASAMEAAYRITRRGGTTTSSSLMAPTTNWGLQHVSMVGEERTIKGSYLGSCVPKRDIPRYIDLYLQGKLPVDKLMGERMALDDINEGFDKLATGEAMRDLIVF